MKLWPPKRDTGVLHPTKSECPVAGRTGVINTAFNAVWSLDILTSRPVFSTRPPLYSSLYFILDVFLIFAVWVICFVGLRAPMSRDNCVSSVTVHSMVKNVVFTAACTWAVGFTIPFAFSVTEAIGAGSWPLVSPTADLQTRKAAITILFQRKQLRAAGLGSGEGVIIY